MTPVPRETRAHRPCIVLCSLLRSLFSVLGIDTNIFPSIADLFPCMGAVCVLKWFAALGFLVFIPVIFATVNPSGVDFSNIPLNVVKAKVTSGGGGRPLQFVVRARKLTKLLLIVRTTRPIVTRTPSFLLILLQPRSSCLTRFLYGLRSMRIDSG